MRITPVSNNYYYKKPIKRKTQPNFTSQLNLNKTSCYFRRGAVVLSSKGYDDIETLFYTIFNNNNKPKNMLIIGVGNSQEPFSYLASIKGIIKDRPLKDNVNLNTIDLQPKPSMSILKKNAFSDLLDYEKYPKFAKTSFVKDTYDNWLETEKKFECINPADLYLLYHINIKPQPKAYHDRVNDEIFNLVLDTYNNPQKSKWDSRVQDIISGYPEKYDIISANNTLGYINEDKEYLHTFKHINRILNPGGYFITDPYKFEPVVKESGITDNLEKIYDGIYRKRP